MQLKYGEEPKPHLGIVASREELLRLADVIYRVAIGKAAHNCILTPELPFSNESIQFEGCNVVVINSEEQ